MILLKDILLESRKFGDTLNKKLSIYSELLKYRNEYVSKHGVGSDINLYISFTEVNKLGINPKSTFDTPIGIYAYSFIKSLNYIKDDDVPFAGKKPYLQIFEYVGDDTNLLSVDTDIGVGEYDRRLSLILSYMLRNNIFDNKALVHIDSGSFTVSKLATQSLNSLKNYFSNKSFAKMLRHEMANNYTSRLYGMCYILSKAYQANERYSSVRLSVLFSKLLMIGEVYGFVDNGYGVIHENEPSQAVFLRKDVLKHNTVLLNTRSFNDRVDDLVNVYFMRLFNTIDTFRVRMSSINNFAKRRGLSFIDIDVSGISDIVKNGIIDYCISNDYVSCSIRYEDGSGKKVSVDEISSIDLFTITIDGMGISSGDISDVVKSLKNLYNFCIGLDKIIKGGNI